MKIYCAKKKKRCQFIHLQKRARERFGLTINERDHKDMILSIQNGVAEFIDKQSHRVSRWKVILKDGTAAVAIYDKMRSSIVTLLAEGMS